MVRIYLTVLAALLLLNSRAIADADAQRQAVQRNSFLETELIAMGMMDQDVRKRWISYMKEGKEVPKALMAEVHRIDSENLKRLKEIVDKFGWPTYSLVGKEAANAAFLIVQHAATDQPFMRSCLKLMEPLLEKGEVAKPSYALLWDRTALFQKRKQRYGSQIEARDGKWVPMDVEDPKNLDSRRASMGLGPMAKYLKVFEKAYGPPPSDG